METVGNSWNARPVLAPSFDFADRLAARFSAGFAAALGGTLEGAFETILDDAPGDTLEGTLADALEGAPDARGALAAKAFFFSGASIEHIERVFLVERVTAGL